MRLLLTIITLTSLLFTCQLDNKPVIEGQWKAIELREEGDSLAIDLEDVQFQFNNNGRYTFHSTLEYKEAGRYHMDGPFLFSTDTTQNTTVEKAVEIIQLTGDTLILRMQEDGKERTMVLRRERE